EGVAPSVPSTTNKSAETLSNRFSNMPPTFWAMESFSPGTHPPESVKRKVTPFQLISQLFKSRVDPAMLSTKARDLPVRRLKRVDLPTLGRPTMRTSGMGGMETPGKDLDRKGGNFATD